MSGGSLNYFYAILEEHAGDFGDKELDELVKDLAELFHEREWFLSSDTGEGDWRNARDSFKAKWFTEDGRRERIEKYLKQFDEEIRETFGMSRKRCRNCKHWSKESEESSYGRCEFKKHCLMHSDENCERFSERSSE